MVMSHTECALVEVLVLLVPTWLKNLKDKDTLLFAQIGKKMNSWKSKNFAMFFLLMDLRVLQNCVTATKDCDVVMNLAADMGGMGFIASNESVLVYNNTMISSNMVEAARRNGAKRFFYSSSACVYNEKKQLDPENPGLRETDAWPAWPQDTYGLEKLYSEEVALAYGRDFDMEVRIARFHNIYGPHGTWKGGREKVPAAFCRKAASVPAGGKNCSAQHFPILADPWRVMFHLSKLGASLGASLRLHERSLPMTQNSLPLHQWCMPCPYSAKNLGESARSSFLESAPPSYGNSPLPPYMSTQMLGQNNATS